ncbi:MAG TPA: DUF2199 domain-containing protein, partial [Lautropia sp.]|nr:DUF2199 domain-containing protein [Lautropia sp.]
DGSRFVRCVLRLPIRGTADTLEFGVWSTLSAENFERYEATYDDPRQSLLGPMFGWFSTAIPDFPGSAGLKCHVVPQDDNGRPLIELEPTDHPLAIAQYDGVTPAFASEYVHRHLGI